VASKRFHLGDILSITTGKLLSSRQMEGVREILDHMTGEKLLTLGAERAAESARRDLLRQHPALTAVDGRSITTENYEELLGAWVAVFGESLSVEGAGYASGCA
jgi:hypothetical protein